MPFSGQFGGGSPYPGMRPTQLSGGTPGYQPAPINQQAITGLGTPGPQMSPPTPGSSNTAQPSSQPMPSGDRWGNGWGVGVNPGMLGSQPPQGGPLVGSPGTNLTGGPLVGSPGPGGRPVVSPGPNPQWGGFGGGGNQPPTMNPYFQSGNGNPSTLARVLMGNVR
jgi:hypothetical protein